jgi:hypothetical protein
VNRIPAKLTQGCYSKSSNKLLVTAVLRIEHNNLSFTAMKISRLSAILVLGFALVATQSRAQDLSIDVHGAMALVSYSKLNVSGGFGSTFGAHPAPVLPQEPRHFHGTRPHLSTDGTQHGLVDSVARNPTGTHVPRWPR